MEKNEKELLSVLQKAEVYLQELLEIYFDRTDGGQNDHEVAEYDKLLGLVVDVEDILDECYEGE